MYRKPFVAIEVIAPWSSAASVVCVASKVIRSHGPRLAVEMHSSSSSALICFTCVSVVPMMLAGTTRFDRSQNDSTISRSVMDQSLDGRLLGLAITFIRFHFFDDV